MLNVTFRDFTVDFHTLPEVSQMRVLHKGFDNICRDSFAQARSDAVKRGDNAVELAVVENDCIARAVNALVDGTAKSGGSGRPRADARQAIINDLVMTAIRDRAKSAGKKAPDMRKAEDRDTWVTKYMSDPTRAAKINSAADAMIEAQSGIKTDSDDFTF